MSDLQDAIKQVCEEKNISYESVLETIEAALAAAFRKDFGQKNQNIHVDFDIVSQGMDVYDIKNVVEDMDLDELEKQREEFEAKKEAGEEVDDSELKRFNPKTEIMLSEAKELDPKAKIGKEIKTKLEVPDEFGRMAAQTAKQVIIQRLREAERETIYNEFKEREGEVATAVVQRKEGRNVYLDIGHTMAIIPAEEQIPRENYNAGQRFKVLILSVELTPKGPEIIVSRAHVDLLKEMFRSEVPEIASEIVEIKAIAREAGARSKIAVISNQDSIDPVGSCVGQRGTRVQTIIAELGGEKIDIIEWNEDIEKFIANALSPAKVMSLILNEKDKSALVKVKEDQLSLAIGKSGQNVRLAAKLTDWKINIEGAEKIKDEEGEESEEDESEEKDVEEELKTEESKKKKKKAKDEVVDDNDSSFSVDDTNDKKEEVEEKESTTDEPVKDEPDDKEEKPKEKKEKKAKKSKADEKKSDKDLSSSAKASSSDKSSEDKSDDKKEDK